MSSTAERLSALLAEINPEFDFGSSRNFIRDGGLDSLLVVLLTVQVENAFGVSIPGEAISPENFSSINALAALVERSKTGPRSCGQQ